MEIFQAVLLGIFQGIAEFLPISSSEHIVICGELLERFFGTNLTESKLQLNVALHFGTLVSILVIYRAELSQLIHQPRFFVNCAGVNPDCCLFVTAGLLLTA